MKLQHLEPFWNNFIKDNNNSKQKQARIPRAPSVTSLQFNKGRQTTAKRLKDNKKFKIIEEEKIQFTKSMLFLYLLVFRDWFKKVGDTDLFFLSKRILAIYSNHINCTKRTKQKFLV